MDLTILTLDEFLCNKNVPADPSAFSNASAALGGLVGAKIRDLNADYVLHELNSGTAGDVVLLYQGQPVGFYWGETVAIDVAHQGKKLSVPLVLEAVKYRTLPPVRTLSREGRQALTNAWKVANGQMTNPWP